MRRIHVLIGAVLAASGVAMALAVGGSAQAPQAGTTIQLVERAGSETEIDNPPRKKFSQGDEFVFEGKLTDLATGDPAGSDGGFCVVVKAARQSATNQCSVTLFLRDGQIALVGGVQFRRGAGTFTVPVVGGTEAYEGARASSSKEAGPSQFRWSAGPRPTRAREARCLSRNARGSR